MQESKEWESYKYIWDSKRGGWHGKGKWLNELLVRLVQGNNSALVLFHCNYKAEINIDTVCKLFIQKHPRLMEKANLLFD